MRSVRTAAIAVTVIAVFLWGLEIAGIWVRMLPAAAVPVVHDGAVMSGIIAAVCWSSRRQRSDEDGLRLAVRTVDMLTRPAAVRTTGPLRRVQ